MGTCNLSHGPTTVQIPLSLAWSSTPLKHQPLNWVNLGWVKFGFYTFDHLIFVS